MRKKKATWKFLKKVVGKKSLGEKKGNVEIFVKVLGKKVFWGKNNGKKILKKRSGKLSNFRGKKGKIRISCLKSVLFCSLLSYQPHKFEEKTITVIFFIGLFIFFAKFFMTYIGDVFCGF